MARADRIPYLPRQRLVTIDVTLNGVSGFVLLVDTGAERTMISSRAASRLGLDLTRPLRLEPLAGVGQSPPVPVVLLDRMKVGGTEASRIAASVYDLPPLFHVDGLLGMNFLGRYRVSFEPGTRTLVLRVPPSHRTP